MISLGYFVYASDVMQRSKKTESNSFKAIAFCLRQLIHNVLMVGNSPILKNNDTDDNWL